MEPRDALLTPPRRAAVLVVATAALAVVAALLVPTAPPPAAAATAALTVILQAPADVAAGEATLLVAGVTDAAGAPVAGQPLTLVQLLPDGSTAQHPGGTDASGRLAWSLPLAAGRHELPARTPDGSTSPGTAVTAHRASAEVAVAVDPPSWSQSRRVARITLTRTPYAGTPVPWSGAAVTWQRHAPEGWVHAGSTTTDAEGTVTTRLRPGRFRVLVAETPDTAAAVSEVEVADGAPVSVALAVPRRARAGTRLRLRVTTRGAGGRRVRLVLQARTSGRWARVRRTATRRDSVVLRHRPVYDVRYRARVVLTAGGRTRRFTSGVTQVHLTPTVAPFRAPAGAPEPRRRLPAQPRATRPGPAPVVRPIDDRTWRSMVGRSWRPGCPVGRADLRLLRINYYGFDGYRHRGEIVAHRSAVGAMARGLTLLHRHRIRVRSMYRVDRFGWSTRLGGADDYASMAAGNTSAFNCRGVVGRPGRRSPHSWGRSLDLNPWENPYYSPADGWVPNAWYRTHTAGVQTWRSRDHRVVRLLRSAGLRWTYGVLDSHHFDG